MAPKPYKKFKLGRWESGFLGRQVKETAMFSPPQPTPTEEAQRALVQSTA